MKTESLIQDVRFVPSRGSNGPLIVIPQQVAKIRMGAFLDQRLCRGVRGRVSTIPCSVTTTSTECSLNLLTTSGDLEISTGRKTTFSLYWYSSSKNRLRALWERSWPHPVPKFFPSVA